MILVVSGNPPVERECSYNLLIIFFCSFDFKKYHRVAQIKEAANVMNHLLPRYVGDVAIKICSAIIVDIAAEIGIIIIFLENKITISARIATIGSNIFTNKITKYSII